MIHPLVLVKHSPDEDEGFRRALHEAGVVAHSPAMVEVVYDIWKHAPHPISVLLVGPTGAGKDLLARAIHDWSRRSGPLVSFNCGQHTADRVGIEFFGHTQDAYTSSRHDVPGVIEAAHDGSLFLDEVESLPALGQTALLRVVDTKEASRFGSPKSRRVDIRLITAAHEDLQSRIATGEFRKDLFFRLAGATFTLPSLSSRPDDLFPLGQHFAAKLGRVLAAGVEAALLCHPWHGNVRELQHAVARAAILQTSGTISASTVAEILRHGKLFQESAPAPAEIPSTFMELRGSLMEALRRGGGDPTLAAAELGRSRATIYRWMKACGLDPRRVRHLAGRAAGLAPRLERS